LRPSGGLQPGWLERRLTPISRVALPRIPASIADSKVPARRT
jgi:hypothetical protein